MARIHRIPQEIQQKVIENLLAGRDAVFISTSLGLNYESVRWIACKNNIPCPRVYRKKPQEKGGQWINIQARYSGLPDWII